MASTTCDHPALFAAANHARHRVLAPMCPACPAAAATSLSIAPSRSPPYHFHHPLPTTESTLLLGPVPKSQAYFPYAPSGKAWKSSLFTSIEGILPVHSSGRYWTGMARLSVGHGPPRMTTGDLPSPTSYSTCTARPSRVLRGSQSLSSLANPSYSIPTTVTHVSCGADAPLRRQAKDGMSPFPKTSGFSIVSARR